MPAWTRGRARRLNLRDTAPPVEGSGGADGVVIPLQLVYTDSGSSTYILNVTMGGNNQQLPLQLDTGSSDLWAASTSCTACGNVNGGLYDPTGSLPTGQSFAINYLAGSAAGPIVWDKVTVGGYTVQHQALAAASDVEDEPLDAFSGILGLALPPNSVIASTLSAGDPVGADGATWASNLFGMDGAPASRFISFLLERPGSATISSLLGIGMHPSDYVTDPSKVHYSTLVSGKTGATFWKTSVTAITVYVDGEPKPVTISPSASGSAFPTAVMDTGVPVILMTSTLANGIYGALDIHPAQDKNYYVPCQTPLNMTITVDGLTIPLHPLDLTTGQGVSSQTCIGTIQAADELLSSTGAGDMILGVPFLRNVYTVLAHDVPFANGSFDMGAMNNNETFQISPRLGLMNLTDPSVALDEFHTVRVLGKPLSSTGSTDNGSKHSTEGASGLSVGLKVLLGLAGVFALAISLFAVRFWWQRRKWKKLPDTLDTGGGSDSENLYHLPNTVLLGQVSSGAADSGPALSRGLGIDGCVPQKGSHSIYTTDSMRTMVEPDSQDNNEELLVDEFGLVYFGTPGKEKKGRTSTTSRSFSSFPNQPTLVGMGIGEPDEVRLSQRFGFAAFPLSSPRLSEMEVSSHRRSDRSSAHSRIPSGLNSSEPLLTSQRRPSDEWDDHRSSPAVDVLPGEDPGTGWGEEFGTRDSMAGVGAHNRRRSSNGGIDPGQQTSLGTRISSEGPSTSVPRHSRLRSSFDHTVEEPLLPPPNSDEGGPHRA